MLTGSVKVWLLLVILLRETRCQFHQCVYAQLLHSQIRKAQKAAWVDCLFLHYLDLCALKLWVKCWWNWPKKQVKVKVAVWTHLAFGSKKKVSFVIKKRQIWNPLFSQHCYLLLPKCGHYSKLYHRSEIFGHVTMGMECFILARFFSELINFND